MHATAALMTPVYEAGAFFVGILVVVSIIGGIAEGMRKHKTKKGR